MDKKLDDLKNVVKANKLVLENEKVRIMEVALKPGEKSMMHNHPSDYVVYAIDDITFRQTFADGKSGEVNLKAGQAGMMEAGLHEVTNIGNNVGRNLVIELK